MGCSFLYKLLVDMFLRRISIASAKLSLKWVRKGGCVQLGKVVQSKVLGVAESLSCREMVSRMERSMG